jgi:geranylgeranyl pyrophosphate synthase
MNEALNDSGVERPLEGLGGSHGLAEAEAFMVSLGVGGRADRLGGLVREHLEAGGQRMRARLALAAIEALGGDRIEGAPWAAACELLHNATLVHDDLQDGDEVRRGRPALWATHGVAHAINVGDLLLMLPIGAVARLRTDDAVRWRLSRAIVERAEETVRGQALELDLCTDQIVDRQEWATTARGKSGALLALPVEGAALLCGLSASTAKSLAQPFATLGVLYQAWDDAADLFGATGREPGADLREGKPSLPVIEHLRLFPRDTTALLTVLATPRDQTPEAEVSRWLDTFRTGGALDAVRARIAEFEHAVLSDRTLRAVPDLFAIADDLVRRLRARAPAET